MPFTQTPLRDLVPTKENNLRSHPLHRHPRWLSRKEPSCQCSLCGFNPWVRNIPWRRKWQPTPVFLPGESHGQKSLAGYSPWDRRECDTAEQLTHILLEKEMATHPSVLAWEIPHRGVWQGTAHRTSKSQTQLSKHVHTHKHTHKYTHAFYAQT